MKKVLFPVLVLISAELSAQTKPPVKKTAPKPPATAAATTVTLKSSMDSLSYAIGVLDGTFFKTQGITKVNGQLLSKGFTDVINGKTLCSPEEANEIVRREMQKINQAKIQPNIDQGNKFLEENRKKPGIIVTPSGLQYEVVTMGTGPKPTETSRVKVHYTGYLINGTTFDGSRDKGEPAVFSLQEVIKGWTEGLQLMPTGSRFKFYIPYTIGFGPQGSGETIPGGATTIFDIELIEVLPNN